MGHALSNGVLANSRRGGTKLSCPPASPSPPPAPSPPLPPPTPSQIRACSGSQCSDKVALRVTPSGSVAPTMPVAGAQPATPAQPAIPAQQQPAVPAQPAQPALGIMAQPQSLAGWRVVMKNPTATA